MQRQIMVISTTTAWQQLAHADFLMAPILTLCAEALPLIYKGMGYSADANWQISTGDVTVLYFSLIWDFHELGSLGRLCSVPQKKKKTLDPVFSFAYKKWMQFHWFIVVPNEPKGSDEWNMISGYLRLDAHAQADVSVFIFI